jgi:hypothetical protein
MRPQVKRAWKRTATGAGVVYRAGTAARVVRVLRLCSDYAQERALE